MNRIRPMLVDCVTLGVCIVAGSSAFHKNDFVCHQKSQHSNLSTAST